MITSKRSGIRFSAAAGFLSCSRRPREQWWGPLSARLWAGPSRGPPWWVLRYRSPHCALLQLLSPCRDAVSPLGGPPRGPCRPPGASPFGGAPGAQAPGGLSGRAAGPGAPFPAAFSPAPLGALLAVV